MHKFHGHLSKTLLLALLVLVFIAPQIGGRIGQIAPVSAQGRFANLIAKAQNGPIEVLITLNLANYKPDGSLSRAAAQSQQAAIAQAQSALLSKLAGQNYRLIAQYSIFPIIHIEADAATLQLLATLPEVMNIQENYLGRATDLSSNSQIGAPSVWAQGFDGTNQVVLILDSGVQTTHPFLAGKSLSTLEACFSRTSGVIATTVCPNGVSTSGTTPGQAGTGAGVNCSTSIAECDHGTHVAGTAAGLNYTGGPGYDGVARGANIISVQVFSRITGTNCANNGLPDPCALYFVADLLSAMQYISTTIQPNIPGGKTLASVNMSLGGSLLTPPCDATNTAEKTAIDNMVALGIAPVVAAGNNGSASQLTVPGCISSAIPVGSVNDDDTVSGFSNRANVANFLYAPGNSIDSSVPGNGFGTKAGTSMASPHVAGAFAVLKQRYPGNTVAQSLTLLQTTGLPITDNGFTKSRIRLNIAVPTATPTNTSTATNTATRTNTSVPTNTNTATRTNTSVPTATNTATRTSTPTATFTSTPVPNRPDTIGVYKDGFFYLRNTNTTGPADITVLYGGGASQVPITGDWNGDGIDTIGIYDTNTGVFQLRDSNSTGPATYVFTLGNPGDSPLSGRWDATLNHDAAGVYRPSNGILFLRDTLTTGFADYYMVLGNPGDTGLAGDWNNDGFDTVGIYRPTGTRFFLSNVNGAGITFSDVDFLFFVANATPFAGDWTGTGQSRLGWFTVDSLVAYRNSLTDGNADLSFTFGPGGGKPLAGKWVAVPAPSPLTGVIDRNAPGYLNGDTGGGAE